MDSKTIIPPDKTWSHSPRRGRDEAKVYRLPTNEVLPFLIGQTPFLSESSSEANDEARQTIFDTQYPRLRDPIDGEAARPAWSPEDIASRIGSFVRSYATEHLDSRFVKVGYTPVLQEHAYSDGAVTQPNAIVLGLPMRFDETNAAPEPQAGEEVTRNYMELGGLTVALAQQMRRWGFAAEILHPRGDEMCICEALYVPHAIAAGFGELGRHGSMISREFGPRIRLAMVTTDALLPASRQDELGVAAFCTWCTKCLAACPVDAIPHEREMLRGSYRYIIDTTKCLPYFAETDGCGICIAVCPYNKPTEDVSSAFCDSVQEIDWVRTASQIRDREGDQAMERSVRERKAGA